MKNAGASRPIALLRSFCCLLFSPSESVAAGRKREELEGTIEITVGEECHRLREVDCLAMQLDDPTIFRNPTRKQARYVVVMASEPNGRPRR